MGSVVKMICVPRTGMGIVYVLYRYTKHWSRASCIQLMNFEWFSNWSSQFPTCLTSEVSVIDQNKVFFQTLDAKAQKKQRNMTPIK